MEDVSSFANELVASKDTFILIMTAGLGILVGKIARVALKVVIYVIGAFVAFLMGLEYLGIIFLTVNTVFLQEIFAWTFNHAKSLGYSNHVFFWLPMLYSMKRRGLRPLS